MIDPATSWFKVHEIPDKKSITVANIVEQEWFSRYPWPTQVVYDRGSEFMGHDFKNMVKHDYGALGRPITSRNPQANAVLERIHQVIGNIIRSFELQTNYLDEDEPWKGILSAVAFAIRATYHTTLQKTPAQLVYGRDLIFNLQHKANWELIRQRKQALINKNNEKENSKRTPHNYHIGDQVMIRTGTEYKQEQPYQGPFRIVRVNTNGTVHIQKGPVREVINIRQLEPFTTLEDFNRGGGCNMQTSKKHRS